MIGVYIVDDSPVVRQTLKHILESDPAIRVIGEASSGEEALRSVQDKRPDVITMDINMSGMDGHEATSRIMETAPVPIVIVSANYNRAQVEQSFRAMEAGAVAIIEKPPGPGHPGYSQAAAELVQTVKLMSEVKVVKRWLRARPAKAASYYEPRVEARSVRLVAIGASTGGPPVLHTVLAGLRSGFPAPILVVQHIAKGFIGGMVDWLSAVIEIPVKVAEEGERLLPGRVYFAPDGRHLGVDGPSCRAVLSADESENGLRPSVSYLFRSALRAYGPEVLGVLLTGMGKDGAQELRDIKGRGGVTIVQDFESSVVYGMPGEAVRLGGASYILPPEKMAARIEAIVNGEREREHGRGW